MIVKRKKKTEQRRLLPEELYQAFTKNGVDYFCGVPDSLLSSFGFYVEDHSKGSHDIAVNEGNAVAMAMGYYLATERMPLVYMQNSGLGNAINPLTSLVDPLVMGIPMLLLIGWRGQPGKDDEPQHVKQGLLTTKLLVKLDIPYVVLSRDGVKAYEQVTAAVRTARKSQRPFALLVESKTLAPYQNPHKHTKYALTREEVIGLIAGSVGKTDAIVATTGKTSRELFEYREKQNQTHRQDLLVVGGMGHASSIASSIAQQQLTKKIYCIDGDGAMLMHMGSLASIGHKGLENFYHIVINNGSHESVGGQPTVGFDIDIPAIAKACGYRHVYFVKDKTALDKTLLAIKSLKGPVLVEIRVNISSRSDLSRPTVHPSKNKEAFISFIQKT